jgi:hypothetical protein
MEDLIGRLRLMIADPTGDGQVFSDDELQEFLDARRAEHRYRRLEPLPTIGPGGAVTYEAYHSGTVSDWEEGGTLYGPDFGAIEPETSDWRRGRWELAEHQPEPVYITGRTYDLAAAGADALETWAAKLKAEYDIRAGDQTFERSAQIRHMLTMAAALRRRQRVRSATWRRSDLC